MDAYAPLTTLRRPRAGYVDALTVGAVPVVRPVPVAPVDPPAAHQPPAWTVLDRLVSLLLGHHGAHCRTRTRRPGKHRLDPVALAFVTYSLLYSLPLLAALTWGSM